MKRLSKKWVDRLLSTRRSNASDFCSRRTRAFEEYPKAFKNVQDTQFCEYFPNTYVEHLIRQHTSASHHAERIKLKKKHVDISSTVCSLLRVHRRGTKVVFCSRHERQKFSKMHHRFLAQKWSNNTDDDDGGASTSKIESMRTTTTALVETYENGREIWYARSRTRKRFRKSSLESS